MVYYKLVNIKIDILLLVKNIFNTIVRYNKILKLVVHNLSLVFIWNSSFPYATFMTLVIICLSIFIYKFTNK